VVVADLVSAVVLFCSTKATKLLNCVSLKRASISL